MFTPPTPDAKEATPLLREFSRKDLCSSVVLPLPQAHTRASLVIFPVILIVVGVTLGTYTYSSISHGQIEGDLCTFSQLAHGLRIVHDAKEGVSLGFHGEDILTDISYAQGLLYIKPGGSLPFSTDGHGFTCGPEYTHWLRRTALYTPNQCRLLTPPANLSPFAGTGVRKIRASSSPSCA
jgi:hypothetical protein